jgi:hypothetical protein
LQPRQRYWQHRGHYIEFELPNPNSRLPEARLRQPWTAEDGVAMGDALLR